MQLTQIQLKRPRSGDCAKQCREMGLEVGNIIVGRETYSSGEWSEAKLTLLFLGKYEAMWSVKRRSSARPNWRSDGECGNWTLDCRQWHLVG
jgi:hypothetical protein